MRPETGQKVLARNFRLRWARFARIDLQIRANRLILRESFQGPQSEPLFGESHFGGLKIANRRFEAIRSNRSLVNCESFFFFRCAGPSKISGWDWVRQEAD